MRYVEGKKDKELKNKILSTWKDLLKLREQLGYQSTSIKLNVKKKNSDSDRDQKAKWESDLKQEIRETLEELKSVYKKSLAEYKENYALWNQKNRNKVRFLKKV